MSTKTSQTVVTEPPRETPALCDGGGIADTFAPLSAASEGVAERQLLPLIES